MNIEIPVLGYYISKVDISWVPETMKIQSVNLGVSSRKDAITHGYVSSGQPPPLSDYYDLRCRPIITQPHIELHTALSDTLLLYELLHTGIIEMKE